MTTANVFSISGTTFTGIPNGGSLTTANCVGTQTGSQANGRDQTAAFASNAKVYWWQIQGSSTPAFLASLSATAPTWPTGYTRGQVLATAQLIGGSFLTATILIRTTWLISGPWLISGRGLPSQQVFYDNAINDALALNGGTAVGSTPTTSFSIASFVPSEADTFDFLLTSGGVSGNVSKLGYVSGAWFAFASYADPGAFARMPQKTAGLAYYNNTVTNGQTWVYVLGYEIRGHDWC